jgi:hypothetical protein
MYNRHTKIGLFMASLAIIPLGASYFAVSQASIAALVIFSVTTLVFSVQFLLKQMRDRAQISLLVGAIESTVSDEDLTKLVGFLLRKIA